MNTKQKSNWWMDAGLFAGLLILFYMDLTGVELHQWIGIFGTALVVYHLVAHWNWVKAVSQRFFGNTSGRVRGTYLIDAALFAGIAMIVFTGLMISTWLNLSLSNYPGWLRVHITASILTLCVVVLKLALHWRWIVSATRSVFAEPVQPAMKPVPVPVQAGPRQMNRREFLRVMGVVGVSSFLALTSASASLKMLNDSENTASAQDEVSTASASVADASSSSRSSSSSACTVRCNHRCSYPGHCHKYTDSNDNGLCDLGECT